MKKFYCIDFDSFTTDVEDLLWEFNEQEIEKFDKILQKIFKLVAKAEYNNLIDQKDKEIKRLRAGQSEYRYPEMGEVDTNSPQGMGS